MEMKNKVAIITGGARGIGREVALKLAEDGEKIVIADLREERGKDTVRDIEKKGSEAMFMKTDVSDKEMVSKLINTTVNEFGKINILVNSAGITQRVDFEDLKEKDWDTVIDVNLKGVFLCSQAVIPFMKKVEGGKIVNLASLGGKTGGILIGANYAASKAGVVGLTKSIAKAVAPYNINVNAVSPGFIDTEMTKNLPYDVDMVPLKRLGVPEEVADVICFLVSDAASYIDGEIVDVDGGILMD